MMIEILQRGLRYLYHSISETGLDGNTLLQEARGIYGNVRQQCHYVEQQRVMCAIRLGATEVLVGPT